MQKFKYDKTITKISSASVSKKQETPLAGEMVKAGFPVPAEDFVDHKLDLNQLLIKHPEATFFVRVSGDSMIDAGISSGDLLIVDRSLEAVDKSIIIAMIDGELTVKRFKKSNDKISLVAENKNYKPIEISGEMNFEVWGVVTGVVKEV